MVGRGCTLDGEMCQLVADMEGFSPLDSFVWPQFSVCDKKHFLICCIMRAFFYCINRYE
jgi:hypothetical protein